MALFTDQSTVTLDDLLQFETTLAQIASTHGINVDTKISLATSVIGDQLMLWLLDVGASDPQWLTRRTIGLSTVVVTPPLRRWLCYESLSRFFAEAYNLQLNSRFQGKWQEYRQEAKNANTMASLAGVGIVYNSLPKPALPLVSIQSGNQPAESLFVQTAWVDTEGNEGALSPVNGLLLPDNSSITVAMAEGEPGTPLAATGWNVYVSSVNAIATLQNPVPLIIGSTWDLPSTGITDGRDPIDGQQPDFYITISNQIRRG
ncbi:MAG TPA: hypothetical protein VGL97_18200 [Bryobacteraceae bacterium]|jgi:hypothetical protein